MLNHFFVVFVAVITITSASAADLAEQLEQKLQSAITADNAVAAEKWATALAQVRAAENLRESAKMARRAERLATGYENVLRTLPGFITALQAKQGGRDTELDQMLLAGQFLLKAWNAPQDEKSCKEFIQKMDDLERSRK